MWENEESWYFPELNREQAKTILLGAEMGVFLVRVSGTTDRPGPVLSVSHFFKGAQVVYHYAINKTNDDRYIHGNLTFPSLHAFLLHYRSSPLTDDGLLRLTNPADVKYFAKNDWTGSSELAKKIAISTQNSTPVLLLPINCGQILRLIKRNPINTPISSEDGSDAKLWLMETDDRNTQGLVPSNCLLVYVRSEYESFMQRQRHQESVARLEENLQVSAPAITPVVQQLAAVSTPPPLLISRPAAFSCSPFSERRLGNPSQLDALQQTQSCATAKQFAASDKLDNLPDKFPAKAVAVLDRNPNFYDRAQLRFKKGDILTVSKPGANTMGIDDSLAYGWAEACIDDNSGRRGLVPLFSNAYLKWL